MILGSRSPAPTALTVVTVVTAALAGSVLAGCGDGSDADEAATPIVATTSIWADITAEVACGAEIPSVIPPGADPHGFEPSLRDRELLDSATTVVANGLGLETALVDLLDTVDADVIEMANHVDVITDDEHGDGDDADDEDGHGHADDGDPHIWQDPRRVAGALDVIGSAVAADGLDTCTDRYRDQLLALDAEIEQRFAAIPPEQRVMVTSHDSFAYFADRYGVTVVGTVIPSTTTLAETNAADLADLAEAIEQTGVTAVFTDEFESSADADALARRLGIDVVPLVTGALGTTSDTDTYVGMMRHNAELIAATMSS